MQYGVVHHLPWSRKSTATSSGKSNRPLYLLLSGFASGQALGCDAVARADRMQKSMQKHCRDTENDQSDYQSVVLNRRLPVLTFSPNHWSWRCHFLAPHWAEIDRLASGAERARESSLPSQTLVLPLQLPSRKARQVREELAEAGKQIEEHKKREEEMERLLASANVRMPAQKLRSRILSFENVKGNDD